MQPWVPLFDIFLNSPSPEMEASVWLQQSFDAASTAIHITPGSFLTLLSKPTVAVAPDPSSPSSSAPSCRKTVMWMETLPSAVQSRILSFLLLERKRFGVRGLSKLAQNILCRHPGPDFWVEKAARNLLDVMPEPKYNWISGLGLDSTEEKADEDFLSLPACLAAENGESALPWLPISPDDLSSTLSGAAGRYPDSLVEDRGDEDESGEYLNHDQPDISRITMPVNASLDPELQEAAASIRAQLLTFDSTSDIVGLAHEIRDLCLRRGGDASAVLGLIRLWEADDETASVLISHLSNGGEGEAIGWPSLVLCSVILPKLLPLRNSASRALVSSTVAYCKLHQRAAVRALVLPLILGAGGIGAPAADMISKIIRECLHPGHVSAFSHGLLCSEEEEKACVCLPCHRPLISQELVWTEPLFSVFQTILNHNVYLTRDSIHRLVQCIEESAGRFSKSLKFGNLLLCFVSKCSSSLRPHRLSLIRSARHTDTLVTKSLIEKLVSPQ